MTPFFILVISFLILRATGWLGVKHLSSWKTAGRVALAITFLFTGVTHFTAMRHDYLAMIPDPFPQQMWAIYLTGAFEIAGAIGLLIPGTRKIAGLCLMILLIAMFPANVNAALNEISFRGQPPTSLWLRTPIQIFFIAMIWWASVQKASGQSEKETV